MVYNITCVSQQSRFHAETLDTASTEVDLKGVTVTVGTKLEVLSDCHLRFKSGVRYGFLGRNGSGKSTLLLALRDSLIPGFPPSVRVLLVSQTEEDSSPDLKDGGGGTVLEKVIATDRKRVRAVREFDALTHAVESSDVDQISRVVAEIERDKIRDEMEDKKRIAMRRSGTRGNEARKEELKAEAKMAEAESKLAALSVSEPSSHLDSDHLADAVSMLADLQTTLDLLDYKTTVARASVILSGLGFTQDMIEGKYTKLSGGWRSRCALAGGLLVGSELLLLDEPNNFLDLEATIWLEQYLVSSEGDRTVVITSHDQDFLDNVVDETVYIRGKTLRYFEGTPRQLEIHERKEKRKNEKAMGAMDKKKAHIENSIREGKKTGKKTGDENRLRMVASRQKKLDERWGIEQSAKGGRFKLNRDLMGFHNANRAELGTEDVEPPVRIYLSSGQPAKLRTTGNLVTLENVSFRYPKTKKPIFEAVTLGVDQGGRCAFVGANGQGKSTLANLITSSLTPTSGTITLHPLLRIGHFSQHSVELLSSSVAGTKITPLEYFLKQFPGTEEGEARACLGGLGLSGRLATGVAVEALSGGQKVRLAFSLVIFRPPPLLILDEPTTHLDLSTIRALAVALRAYEGAIILISHDRWFCRTVVELAPLRSTTDSDNDDDPDSGSDSEEEASGGSRKKGTVYRVGGGKVRLMEGGVDEYAAKVEKLVAKRERIAAAAKSK
ncbi:P-loop containing nucleoside triphosphate hydrolase protein [Mrakia frigida]|uniref:ABC-F family ATP-binding cassette domain-containing protein n=1 Tax=Mrakia frigida TaxID=29902 RepID=UPI003FCBF167